MTELLAIISSYWQVILSFFVISMLYASAGFGGVLAIWLFLRLPP